MWAENWAERARKSGERERRGNGGYRRKCERWAEISTAPALLTCSVRHYSFSIYSVSKQFAALLFCIFCLVINVINFISWLLIITTWNFKHRTDPTHKKSGKFDPTQPNSWMDPVHDQLWRTLRAYDKELSCKALAWARIIVLSYLVITALETCFAADLHET